MTKERFEQLNDSYIHEHGYRDSDLDMAQIYATAVRNSRSSLGVPKVGDILTINGTDCHIEEVEQGEMTIVHNAYVPFISCRFEGGHSTSIKTNTSGGPFKTISMSRLKSTRPSDRKTKLKRFCFWGRGGMKGNGAVEFEESVNVFELQD